MKNLLLILVGMTFLVSCSTPKYTYNFDYYDYNSGRKKAENQVALEQQLQPVELSGMPDQETLVASVAEDQLFVAKDNEVVSQPEAGEKRNVTSLSKVEKKELRKEALKSIKEYVKARKNGDNVKAEELAKAMDKDLKLAAIFGAIGFVGLALGGVGDFFYIIGGIALIIGVVFFVMWLMRQ